SCLSILWGEILGEKAQGCNVAIHTQTSDNAAGLIRKVRELTERLTRVHVRDVYFHITLAIGNFGQRVAYSYRRVSKGARVDDDGGVVIGSRVHSIKQYAFVVGLHKIQFHACLVCVSAHEFLNIGQSSSAVDFRLTLAQAVQVWSVDYNNLHVEIFLLCRYYSGCY